MKRRESAHTTSAVSFFEEICEGEIMEQKPVYFDGSGHIGKEDNSNSGLKEEVFQITDEMRANIGRNPYSLDSTE
jgi:hypothetical protein